MKYMLGVVLCGGQSLRMGTDKGLIKLHASTWAQTAVDKISQLHVPVVISVNAHQYTPYATVFSPELLTIDNPTFRIKGPLCGVLSVHLQYPDKDLLVLACDMPLMEQHLLKKLLQQYDQQSTSNAIVFTNNGEPEPLCGIYKREGLKYILALYNDGKLAKHSMKYMLEHTEPFYISLTEEQKKYFRNFNAHAELNGL